MRDLLWIVPLSLLSLALGVGLAWLIRHVIPSTKI